VRPLLRNYDALRPLNAGETAKLHPSAALALGLGAIALQVFLPRLTPAAGLLDLPLLAVVYVAVMRRHVLAGMLAGMLIGLAQDGLTHGPFGLFGITKTIIGYSAAALSQYIEVDFPGARAVLCAFFFLVHQAVFWALAGGLLERTVTADPVRALMLGAVHAGLALMLYGAFDRLKRTR
jgi:rod shape-determining protein MreD